MENDIMKAKINVTKEELNDHLDDIIDQVDIGKRYEINGDDYNITITSITQLMILMILKLLVLIFQYVRKF